MYQLPLHSLVVTGIEDKLRREVLRRPAHGEGLGVHLRLVVDNDREGDLLGETEVNQPRVSLPIQHNVLGLRSEKDDKHKKITKRLTVVCGCFASTVNNKVRQPAALLLSDSALSYGRCKPRAKGGTIMQIQCDGGT